MKIKRHLIQVIISFLLFKIKLLKAEYLVFKGLEEHTELIQPSQNL